MGGGRSHLALLIIVIVVFIWSLIAPHDYFTWFLEVMPAIIGVAALIAIYPRFKFTCLAYTLIAIHAAILMVGGHYTYAQVPLGDWAKDAFHLSRNHYDRLGHFAQGFVPAVIAREVLIRRSPLKPGGWLTFIVICIALAISASYELLEWGVSVATGTAADAFLGTQGDVWDTQWDMFMALNGAWISQLALGKLHDRMIGQIPRCLI